MSQPGVFNAGDGPAVVGEKSEVYYLIPGDVIKNSVNPDQFEFRGWEEAHVAWFTAADGNKTTARLKGIGRDFKYVVMGLACRSPDVVIEWKE